MSRFNLPDKCQASRQSQPRCQRLLQHQSRRPLLRHLLSFRRKPMGPIMRTRPSQHLNPDRFQKVLRRRNLPVLRPWQRLQSRSRYWGQISVGLIRAIIAEKTGYPEDMLEPDMDLEGELGVDSIKQVEILSTLRERMPDLPEIDPEQLVELRTISAIAEMIDASSTGAAAPAAAPVSVSEPERGAANGGISADTVRALIAEKTGYPEDMLEDDMDLEGELGVDLIKQVEILSALRDQHPELPEVDPEVLADLRTIRAIADFLGRGRRSASRALPSRPSGRFGSGL